MKNYLKRTAIFCLAALGTTVYANDKFEVLNHESLGTLDAKKEPGDSAFSRQGRRLSMEGFGKRFDIVLKPNDRLVANLPAQQRRSHGVSYQAYRGYLEGVEGSWARLTQTGKTYSGVVWDGDNLYAIEPYADMKNFLPSGTQYNNDEHLMYEATDMLDLESGVCAVEDPGVASTGGDQYQQLVDELKEAAAAQAAQRLNVAIVADTQFSGQNASDVDAAVVTRLNIVDGVFSEQVGVEVNVNNIRSLSDNGPLSSTNSQTLLRQLSDYSSSGQIDNPGLVHMLTGRDLNDNVIGIAYLSALCSRQIGVGVTQSDSSRSVTASALTAAHEFGHNFGAPHDNQGGSACASTPGTFLMNPSLNGSDTFSDCSLEQILPVVNRSACLVSVGDPGDPDPEPNPPADTLLSADFDDGTAQGFGLLRGAFRNTDSPAAYERAFIANSGGFSGGALQVELGGVDNADIFGMSAGVGRSFTVDSSTSVKLAFRVNLIQSSEYESDEYSEVLASLDGNLLERDGNSVMARIDGDGNGGGEQSTGYIAVEIDLGVLSAGEHELFIGGYNNKKTLSDESTQIFVDDVVVTAE